MSEEYDGHSSSTLNRLLQKSKDEPFVPIGLFGLFAVCGLGVYNFKRRGKMSTSMYLMQLRVVGQGSVVGCMTLGVIYTMLRDYVFKNSDEKKP